MTGLGAAIAAGLRVGVWESLEGIKKQIELERVFQPQMGQEWRDKKRARYAQAVERSIGFGYE